MKSSIKAIPFLIIAASSSALAVDTSDRLFGDLEARKSLAEHGFDLRLEATNFYHGLVDGTGDEDLESGGKLDFFLAMDGQKAGLWPGLFFNVHGEYRYGEVSAQAGALTPVNAGLISPRDEDEVFALTNVVITQAFSESVLLSVGKFNTVDLADQTFLGGRGVENFMNTSFVAPPIGGRTVPISTLGAILSVLDEGKPLFNFGILDSNSPLTSSGFDGLSSDEMTFLANYTFHTKINGLDGSHTFGGTYSTIDAFSLDKSDYLIPPENPGIVANKKSNSWQISYTVEQFISQSSNDPAKGWGVFGMLAWSDGNPNPFEYSAALGLAANGVNGCRPLDKFGFGLFWNGVSNDLKDTLSNLVKVQDEYGAEIFYDAAILPWLRIGADLQWVRPVIENNDNALYFGLRSRFIF